MKRDVVSWALIPILVLLFVTVILAGLGCGGWGCYSCSSSDNETGLTIRDPSNTEKEDLSIDDYVPEDLPSNTGQAGQDVMQNYTYFFKTATPPALKAQLLQNGQQHVSELDDLATDPRAWGLSATVTGASWTEGESTAKVEYDLYKDSETLATGLIGTAVLEDGIWKVSEEDYFAYIALMRGEGE